MRNQRGRGRGRGGRSSHGPSLPFKITKELDIDSGAVQKPRNGGSMFRVSQRKEQRKAARHKGKAQQKIKAFSKTIRDSQRTPHDALEQVM